LIVGVFDYVTCRYAVPGIANVDQIEFKTYDTKAQYLDDYEIRSDGTLWHRAYDPRVENHKAAPLGVVVHRRNERWEQDIFAGQLRIYSSTHEVLFWFSGGRVKDITVIRGDDHGQTSGDD
jgi:hypothetical protein